MSTLSQASSFWSATPTPFTKDYRIDEESVERMVQHHISRGVAGLMLAGTCGEGAWMRGTEIETLTRSSAQAAHGKIRIALQVTDNSELRILHNIENAQRWGAEMAVVSAPYFLMNVSSRRLLRLYQKVARESQLPIIFYDRSGSNSYAISDEDAVELMMEPNIWGIKDSTAQVSRRDAYLRAKSRRPELMLLTGDEFKCLDYIQAGYDGLFLGGGIFNASIGHRIVKAVQEGRPEEAAQLQQRMNDLMFRVYGGIKIECWLTGLKELLVQMKIFSNNTNLLGYPLTETCRAQIRAAVSGEDGLGYREDLLANS